MVIGMHDYGEFLNVAERLTALGIKWHSGDEVAKLYPEHELFTSYRTILKLIIQKEPDNRLAVLFNDNADIYTDYEDFMRLPVNYALNKITF